MPWPEARDNAYPECRPSGIPRAVPFEARGRAAPVGRRRATAGRGSGGDSVNGAEPKPLDRAQGTGRGRKFNRPHRPLAAALGLR